MKEIIGDDYPTYEDSVKLTLAEREVHKDNLERLLKENLQLKHRLACIADDIEIIERHINSFNLANKAFKQPSKNKDGSIYADEAWHNITNIQIACDLSDESVKEWGSPLAEEYRKMLMEE
tara:strand:- start:122 stop:484 length:363 start_codon:yes stop_codon:yes gene_type:complete